MRVTLAPVLAAALLLIPACQANASPATSPNGDQAGVSSACDVKTHVCRVFTKNSVTGQTKTVKRFKTPCGSIHDVTLADSTLVFSSLDPYRLGKGRNKCRYPQGESSDEAQFQAASLVVLGLKRHSKSRTIARLRPRLYLGPNDFGHILISKGLITWEELHGDSGHANGRQRLYDRGSGRKCELTPLNFRKYPFELSQYITSIQLAESSVTWTVRRSPDELDPTTVTTYSQRGCAGERVKIAETVEP